MICPVRNQASELAMKATKLCQELPMPLKIKNWVARAKRKNKGVAAALEKLSVSKKILF